MQEKWMVKTKRADFNELGRRFNISPIIARLMINRDIKEEEFYDYLWNGEKNLYSPYLMKDMDKTVKILNEKIKENRKIRVIGDYDIDGVCATYILTDVINHCGGNVDMQIPERINDGYGINNNILYKAIEDKVDTIITCDNGIAAIEQANIAKENGITYIVTDHHEVMYNEENGKKDYILPMADAIVNPKQSNCNYPFKGLCGAAIAFKIAMCLTKNPDKINEYNMFAAIATVGDIMELKDENRQLVKKGLSLMHCTEHIGLNALINKLNIKKENIDTYHIGFMIGPCINASGRLETADRAYGLLMAESITKANAYAEELVLLNNERKTMTVIQTENALKLANDMDEKVLVIYLKECHESIAGIVAGKVKEATGKPVFVITDGKEGLKGSGRSIENYNMYDEMTKCKRYMSKYGGHKMAAGLSFDNENNMEEFRKMINDICTLSDEDIKIKINIDMALPYEYITKKLINELNIMAPYGNGNEKPVFALKNIRISKLDIVGKNRNVISMITTDDSGYNMKSVYFGDVNEFMGYLNEKYGAEEVDNAMKGKNNTIRLNITFYPSINEYKNNENINIVIGHYC